MFDAAFWAVAEDGPRPDGSAEGGARLYTMRDGTNSHPTDASLADSRIDASGAVAVVNDGRWFSHAATVARHSVGEKQLWLVASGGDSSPQHHKPGVDPIYYLEGTCSPRASASLAQPPLSGRAACLVRNGASCPELPGAGGASAPPLVGERGEAPRRCAMPATERLSELAE